MPKKNEDPGVLITRYFAAKELAKEQYDLADAILLKLAKKLKRGEPFKISDREAVVLKNNYLGKSKVVAVGFARKWELEKVKIAVTEA